MPKGFTRKEKSFFWLFLMMPVTMATLPWKDVLFVAFCIGAKIALAAQPWEIWKNKDAGAVEIRLLFAYFMSSAFWVIYAFRTGQWILGATTSFSVLLFILTIFLWFRYVNRGKRSMGL